MRHVLRYFGHRLYTSWSTFWFVLPFVVTYPVQVLLSQRPHRHRALHALNRAWSVFAIRLWGVPLRIRGRRPLPTDPPCVYVANHSSYIDIPVLFMAIPGFLNVIGKSALARVPAWGPIFGRSYITVNRESAVSRGRSMVQARQSLEQGRSVIIFPEGTISPKPGEEMMPFKEGAFQLAIAAGVPIVPVSMPLNHRFMPDVADTLRVRYSPLEVVFHAPLPTKGLTSADAARLRDEAFAAIASSFRPEAAGIPPASSWHAPTTPTATYQAQPRA